MGGNWLEDMPLAVVKPTASICSYYESEKWSRLFEQLSPIYKWTLGGLPKGAELSTAASVACNERKAAVGNSGRTQSFILCSLSQFLGSKFK